MGSLFFEVGFGCGSPPLVERAVGVDPSRRVPDSRLVHRTHTREASDGLTSGPFRWESCWVLASAFSSGPLRLILPGSAARLGEPPKSRSRRRSLWHCGHLRLAPNQLRTAGALRSTPTNDWNAQCVSSDFALLTQGDSHLRGPGVCASGLTRRVTIELAEVGTCVELVRAGLGVGLSPVAVPRSRSSICTRGRSHRTVQGTSPRRHHRGEPQRLRMRRRTEASTTSAANSSQCRKRNAGTILAGYARLAAGSHQGVALAQFRQGAGYEVRRNRRQGRSGRHDHGHIGRGLAAGLSLSVVLVTCGGSPSSASSKPSSGSFTSTSTSRALSGATVTGPFPLALLRSTTPFTARVSTCQRSVTRSPSFSSLVPPTRIYPRSL